MLSNPSVAGLVNFTESATTYAGKDYIRLAVKSAQTNVDAVVTPKGTGAFSLQQADGTAASGNPRGAYAVDLQLHRTAAGQVASGAYSFTQGSQCTAGGDYAFSQGYGCSVGGLYAFAQGYSCVTNGSVSFAQGFGCTASGNYAFAQGSSCTASSTASFAQGANCTASGYTSFARGTAAVALKYGETAAASGAFSVAGDAQRSGMVLRASTTSATPSTLSADNLAIGTLNQLILQNNQSITAQVLVVAKKQATTASTAHFRLTVCASRGTTAASTVLHTAPVVETLWNPDGAVIAATVDTVNGGVTFTVTTPAGNWHTVADVSAISTIFA